MEQIIKKTNLTKTEQIQTAQEIIDNLSETGNPLEVMIKLKAFKNIVDSAIKQVEEDSITEADKYGKGEHKIMNVGFQVKDGSRRYDFTNDSTYNDLKQQLKDREAFLKGITKEMVDPETGELIQPPVINYTKESITVKFPK